MNCKWRWLQRQTGKEGNWKGNIGHSNDHNLVSISFHWRRNLLFTLSQSDAFHYHWPICICSLNHPSANFWKPIHSGYTNLRNVVNIVTRIHQPKNLVYPEISTLSVMDINHDLEFLYQNRRIPSSYDMPFGGPPLLWGQAPPFSSRSGLSTPGGLPGLGRPIGLGLGPSNGPLPSANQNQGGIGLPQPSMLQHHPSAYNQFHESSSSYGGTRLRDVYTHGPTRPPVASSRDPYLGYSGHPARNHLSPSHPSTPNMAGTSSIEYLTEHKCHLEGTN